METFVILTVHHNDARHVIHVGRFDCAITLVETFQYNLRRLGQPDGVTWHIHMGNIATALAASNAPVVPPEPPEGFNPYDPLDTALEVVDGEIDLVG